PRSRARRAIRRKGARPHRGRNRRRGRTGRVTLDLVSKLQWGAERRSYELEAKSIGSGGWGHPHCPACLSAGAPIPQREDRLVHPSGESAGNRSGKTGASEEQLPEREGLRRSDGDGSPESGRSSSIVCPET